MQKIVFVCLGNICRSPTAEAVVATKARARSQAILVDSAGTGDWHVGEPPYGPMQTAAARRGYDLSGLRARQVSAGDFEAFDVIVVMDEANQRAVETLRPQGNTTPVRLMMSYVPDIGVTAVPDPYYTRNFDEALDLIEVAAEGLLAVLDP
ncbi:MULTISPECIES: low molecular weight protein-tyrosine-phosphatase [Roseobacteraceae]|uniref:protein-tyrosine-phosphatase n=1 Tax=Celeribacter baekdonensis B30 TaxID=1208323 RepID=K2J4E2_9RHOB|nr:MULTISPECIES: low molecular weight protein-tyrosine-phosphatase [Roseobacteraceae]EKE69737.1 low molecular weight phosphotyrosine protein phosphatase [Celeribacter baekdonensis B30]KAB6715241.1 low molecular weight phosphotyrosine protein phosphatase [Roseobacter sp. TSBP12]|tara:strand:+ start:7961 stop:8413 length:453 start_codon:yes stop_codon:yes gene_type:complete